MRYVNELIEDNIWMLTRNLYENVPANLHFLWKQCGYKADNVIPKVDEKWSEVNDHNGLSGNDIHVWVRGTVTTPDSIAEGKRLVLTMDEHSGNPQTILYLDGKMICGIDRNHTEYELEAGRTYDVALYVYYDNFNGGVKILTPYLRTVNEDIEKLRYDMNVAFYAAKCLPKDSPERQIIFKHLEKASMIINRTYVGRPEFYESVKDAERYLEEEFYAKECGKGNPVVDCVGHTHIDVAWLWTVNQTVEKAQRSFTTALELMKKYPEYVFMMTQPQLYQFMKSEAPERYEEIKAKVREGKWEVEGAMWLEADCNIPSGESLVRQLIRGKKFIRNEFGKESRVLWIPDVFGYSAALPQILKKAGVDYFVTSKIAWNDTNKLPHDTFYWKGLDGTEIFTYFLTAFNGMLTPDAIKSTYDKYKTKTWNEATLHPFGHGDGGGGATAEMFEYYRRLEKGLPGMPKTRMTTLNDFLEKVKASFDETSEKIKETPRWDGELYLEFHRGTYTSVARVKKNNRKAEFALRDAEVFSTLSEKLGGRYETEKLDKLFETVSLNQFHDIIPGSSIGPVYKRSDREFAEVLDGAKEIYTDATANIAANVNSNGGILVFNPNSDTGNGLVEYKGKLYTAKDIAPMGYTVVKKLYGENNAVIGDNYIENEYFRVEFNGMGFMTSIFDKTEERELVRPGEVANEIVIYEDEPYQYDAWEVSHYTRLKPYSPDKFLGITPYENGAAKGVTLSWQFNDNIIRQNVILYDNIKRIDIQNDIDITQKHILIKALFPFDIRTTKTVAEVQYGNVERPYHMNTSWDEAKFETCMHKWVDISDNGYGVSLLNDCKYGYGAYDNKLSLTLVKSADYPYSGCDCTNHKFTYAIYPHKFNAAEGGTVEEAYRLNDVMKAVHIAKNTNGTLPKELSIVSCDKKNVKTEVVKKAENGDGTVVRLYDAYGMTTTANVHFGFDVKKAYITNLLEEEPEEIEVTDNTVKLNVKTFEIVTLLLK